MLQSEILPPSEMRNNINDFQDLENEDDNSNIVDQADKTGRTALDTIEHDRAPLKHEVREALNVAKSFLDREFVLTEREKIDPRFNDENVFRAHMKSKMREVTSKLPHTVQEKLNGYVNHEEVRGVRIQKHKELREQWEKNRNETLRRTMNIFDQDLHVDEQMVLLKKFDNPDVFYRHMKAKIGEILRSSLIHEKDRLFLIAFTEDEVLHTFRKTKYQTLHMEWKVRHDEKLETSFDEVSQVLNGKLGLTSKDIQNLDFQNPETFFTHVKGLLSQEFGKVNPETREFLLQYNDSERFVNWRKNKYNTLYNEWKIENKKFLESKFDSKKPLLVRRIDTLAFENTEKNFSSANDLSSHVTGAILKHLGAYPDWYKENVTQFLIEECELAFSRVDLLYKEHKNLMRDRMTEFKPMNINTTNAENFYTEFLKHCDDILDGAPLKIRTWLMESKSLQKISYERFTQLINEKNENSNKGNEKEKNSELRDIENSIKKYAHSDTSKDFRNIEEWMSFVESRVRMKYSKKSILELMPLIQHAREYAGKEYEAVQKLYMTTQNAIKKSIDSVVNTFDFTNNTYEKFVDACKNTYHKNYKACSPKIQKWLDESKTLQDYIKFAFLKKPGEGVSKNQEETPLIQVQNNSKQESLLSKDLFNKRYAVDFSEKQIRDVEKSLPTLKRGVLKIPMQIDSSGNIEKFFVVLTALMSESQRGKFINFIDTVSGDSHAILSEVWNFIQGSLDMKSVETRFRIQYGDVWKHFRMKVFEKMLTENTESESDVVHANVDEEQNRIEVDPPEEIVEGGEERGMNIENAAVEKQENKSELENIQREVEESLNDESDENVQDDTEIIQGEDNLYNENVEEESALIMEEISSSDFKNNEETYEQEQQSLEAEADEVVKKNEEQYEVIKGVEDSLETENTDNERVYDMNEEVIDTNTQSIESSEKIFEDNEDFETVHDDEIAEEESVLDMYATGILEFFEEVQENEEDGITYESQEIVEFDEVLEKVFDEMVNLQEECQSREEYREKIEEIFSKIFLHYQNNTDTVEDFDSEEEENTIVKALTSQGAKHMSLEEIQVILSLLQVNEMTLQKLSQLFQQYIYHKYAKQFSLMYENCNVHVVVKNPKLIFFSWHDQFIDLNGKMFDQGGMCFWKNQDNVFQLRLETANVV